MNIFIIIKIYYIENKGKICGVLVIPLPRRGNLWRSDNSAPLGRGTTKWWRGLPIYYFYRQPSPRLRRTPPLEGNGWGTHSPLPPLRITHCVTFVPRFFRPTSLYVTSIRRDRPEQADAHRSVVPDAVATEARAIRSTIGRGPAVGGEHPTRRHGMNKFTPTFTTSGFPTRAFNIWICNTERSTGCDTRAYARNCPV